MGKLCCNHPLLPSRRLCGGIAVALALGAGGQAQRPARAAGTAVTQATTVPLLLPAGLAYDGNANLYIAETAANLVVRVSPSGAFSTFAGTGVEGYAGDGGAALAALLDGPTGLAISSSGVLYVADTRNHAIRAVDPGSGLIRTVAGTGTAGLSPDGTAAAVARLNGPTFLAFDGAQNLYFSDTRNHLVRRIDHATGLLKTVAGNGTQGFSGDGGPATGASIDTPTGLAVDAAGDVFLSDSHNQRVRRVDAVTGTITTVAGTGAAGFSGDGGSASAAGLHLPLGLTVDAAGNILVADRANQRIRRIDATTGNITTVAGEGTETFAGDGTPAATASMDSPRAVILAPGGLPTLSDTADGRVRQVDANAVIHTLGGLGAVAGTTLTLTGPATVAYGTGTVQATLAASPATGIVTFFDTANGVTQALANVPLSGNQAAMSTASLTAAIHHLSASYAGDSLHASAESTSLALDVARDVLVAAPDPVSLLYGQPVPALTGSLTGVLPQDPGAVTLALTSGARTLSPPGNYLISAAISGAAAANYILTTTPAAVTIAKAPVTVGLSLSGTAFAVRVTSTTSGVPGGTVALLDGSTQVAMGSLSAGGAVLGPALSLGSHTLTAAYMGDANFLGADSPALTTTTGASAAGADFSLAATGQTSVTVAKGSAASFSFAVSPVNGALSSPILLQASGLPAGAAASFNPEYLPPGGTVAAFVMTVQTAKAARLEPPFGARDEFWALLLPLLLLPAGLRRRGRVASLVVAAFAAAALGSMSGCGDRTAASSAQSVSLQVYSILVTGTSTAASGAVLTHSASVTLQVQ